MDRDMQYRHGYEQAAKAWKCSMDMGKQNGHGNGAWTWKCSVDMLC
jgi:hypothetical protein